MLRNLGIHVKILNILQDKLVNIKRIDDIIIVQNGSIDQEDRITLNIVKKSFGILK